MTHLRGHVEKWVIVLDEKKELPEVTEVTISFAPTPPVSASPQEVPTLYDRLESIVGKAQSLPVDASLNKRHYLYGHPKA